MARTPKRGPISRHRAKEPEDCASVFLSAPALLESLDVGVAQVDELGEILYANAQFRALLAMETPEWVSELAAKPRRNLKEWVAVGAWESMRSALREGRKRPTEGELQVLSVDSAQPRTIQLSFAPLGDADRSIRIMAIETTQTMKIAKDLQRSQESLQAMSARVWTVQDEERRRLARDLHDSVGQELAFIIMTLEGGVRKRETLAQVGAEIAARLRKVETDIRTVSYVLHPPLLEEMGLGSALDLYINGFTKRTGINVQLDIPQELPRLHVQRETACFRVIQEALGNVFRHSGSKRAWVTLMPDGSSIRISVRDEGKGFPTGAADLPSKGRIRRGCRRDPWKTVLWFSEAHIQWIKSRQDRLDQIVAQTWRPLRDLVKK